MNSNTIMNESLNTSNNNNNTLKLKCEINQI